MLMPRGCFAPVPTPLDESSRFDAGALAAHLAWLHGQALNGALILGTNGEFASLSLEERREVARAAGRSNPGLQLMLNPGSCALPEVQELTALAADHGYSAVLVPPPWYFRGAPIQGVAEFFRVVLDAARLPVLLYHIPQVTGVPISDAMLDAIGPHPRLGGIKDSTGDPAELRRLSARFGAGYFVGHDRLVAAAQSAGGGGSISACASVVPGLVVAAASDPGQQGKLNSVRSILEQFGLQGAVKAILRRMRVGHYTTRPPLQPLPEAEAERLFAMWDSLGLSLAPR